MPGKGLGKTCRRGHGAGKPPICRVHDLRHTYGALAIVAEVNTATRSRRMDHRPPAHRRADDARAIGRLPK